MTYWASRLGSRPSSQSQTDCGGNASVQSRNRARAEGQARQRGAITEGDEAGTAVTDLQRMPGHTTAKMTGRYIRSGAIVTSQKVSKLRAENALRRKSELL